MPTPNIGLTERWIWTSPARGSASLAAPPVAEPEELTGLEIEGVLDGPLQDEIARRSAANRLNPARGVLTGILLGSACWAGALLLLKHL